VLRGFSGGKHLANIYNNNNANIYNAPENVNEKCPNRTTDIYNEGILAGYLAHTRLFHLEVCNKPEEEGEPHVNILVRKVEHCDIRGLHW